MKKITISLMSLLICVFSLAYAQNSDTLGLPAYKIGDPVFIYPGYTLKYNEKFEQAEWVAYELTKGEVYSTEAVRTNKFKPDPGIPTGSATSDDYEKSGYDRGHLAPAADMKFSKEAMRDCFYYSNMSPQVPAFNRGIWSSLESMVRYWAVENDAVYIVTGPILNKDSYPSIGPDEVAVPEFFYKVILDYREPDEKAIAFILRNTADKQKIRESTCTIDHVEELTGIDFFPALPDDEENRLESENDITLWPLKEFSQRQRSQ
jgi:endonuclease G